MNTYVLTINVGHDVDQCRDALTQAQIVERAYNLLRFEGATVITCAGFWQGRWETSTQIAIAGLSLHDALNMYDRLPILAYELNQCCVFGTVTSAARCSECFANIEAANVWKQAI